MKKKTTKEDFKYGMPEYYIKNKYVFDSQEYFLTISEDIFDDKTVEYANRLIEKLNKKKMKF